MFDKLVESDLNGADLKPRRRIFVASFIFLGLLFATAVVAGIYAADYSLGTNNFDIAELLAEAATSNQSCRSDCTNNPTNKSGSGRRAHNRTDRRVRGAKQISSQTNRKIHYKQCS